MEMAKLLDATSSRLYNGSYRSGDILVRHSISGLSGTRMSLLRYGCRGAVAPVWGRELEAPATVFLGGVDRRDFFASLQREKFGVEKPISVN